MMRDHAPLVLYQRLLTITTRMAALASTDQWEAMLALVPDHDEVVRAITATPITESQQPAMSDCIAQIRVAEQQLKTACLARQRQLTERIQHSVTRRGQIEGYYQVAGLVD